MKHSAAIAVMGFVIFIGMGTVVAANSTSCGLGSIQTDTATNETAARNDDSSFFARTVCSAQKFMHNR